MAFALAGIACAGVLAWALLQLKSRAARGAVRARDAGNHPQLDPHRRESRTDRMGAGAGGTRRSGSQYHGAAWTACGKGRPLVEIDATEAQSGADGGEVSHRSRRMRIWTSSIAEAGYRSVGYRYAMTNGPVRSGCRAANTNGHSAWWPKGRDAMQLMPPNRRWTRPDLEIRPHGRRSARPRRLPIAGRPGRRRLVWTMRKRRRGRAETQIEQSIVRAPIEGTVYQFDLKPGAYLNAGDTVASIGRLDQVRVNVNVDEPDLGHVAVGMPVIITWDALAGRQWAGVSTRLRRRL